MPSGRGLSVPVGDAPFLRCVSFHLAWYSGEFRRVFGHLFEENLARRKNGGAMIARDAHVKLAAFDVFLDQYIAAKFLVDVRVRSMASASSRAKELWPVCRRRISSPTATHAG